MKKLLFIFCLSILMLSSCVLFTYPKSWSHTMQLWPGEEEDQVYLVYGAPARSQELTDGRKIVTYEFKRSQDGDVEFGEVTFGIKDGRVTTARPSGSRFALRGRIKAPTAEPVIK